jgi:hypothetical protein
MRRPTYLSYRAREGVYETHFPSGNPPGESFDEFARRMMDWSSDGDGDFCILDTFLSDTLELGILETMFSRAPKEDIRVRILLLNPHTAFAVARAKSIGEATAIQRAKRGLQRLVLALERSLRISGPHDIDGDIEDLLGRVRELGKRVGLELRYFSEQPGGPLYFFRDILIEGRYGARRSSSDLYWRVVVSDPAVDGDIFSRLKAEFEDMWEGAAVFQPYTVFISYSEKNSGEADDLHKRLKEIPGVDPICARAGISKLLPGEDWKGWIVRHIAQCDEFIGLHSDQSMNESWVTMELGAAWISQKRISTVLLGDYQPSAPVRDLGKQCYRIGKPSDIDELIGKIAKRAMEFNLGRNNRTGS